MASHALGHDPLIGVELGHYRILDEVGVGGMGKVYRALDQHLSREVAIKVLPPGIIVDEAARKRFRKEALILSRLDHPNIATIYDFDTKLGTDFLVMEYVAGSKVREKLTGKPLSEKDIVNLGVQLADGLAAAHERAIIHRDLKPDNLRLTADGRLKILDFGLAKFRHPVTASASTDSDIPALAGTLPYMAPEQLRGEEVDARTDIHAAGAVLYELATARPPFAETVPLQQVEAILHRYPSPPGSLNRSLSSELERIVLKCLEKLPENRYQSAKELAVDLRGLQRTRDSVLPSSRVSSPEVTPRSVNKVFRRALATAVIAALILLSVWFVTRKTAQPRPNVVPAIAVLPFADLSPEKNQEYFSDGLAEEMLNSLSRLQGLRVAARTSSFQFKGQNEDLQDIGKKLDVGVVLEGSVRKQAQRVRIAVQLVRVSDGSQLWSEIYDRDLNDIFSVQEEIAHSVAGALSSTLLRQPAPAPHATNLEAYNAYLKGNYFYARPTKENLERAITHYEEALSHDASYAPAWAALSRAHSVHAGAFGPLQEYETARQAAERALALDPNLAGAYAAIGEIKLDYDWDWAGADAAYQKALSLENGNPEIVERAASVAATRNRFEEAMELSRRAVELDPLRILAHQTLAYNAWWSGHLDEAEAAARRGLEFDSQYPSLHAVLNRVYLSRSDPEQALAQARIDTEPIFQLQGTALAAHALGRNRESDLALAELEQKYGAVAAFQVAEVHAFRGNPDAAFAWLNRAYHQRDGGLTFVKGDPLLSSLAHDPRYLAFLKKMRLAP